MPWVTIPFGDDRIRALKTEMGVSGIPMLCVYKKDGTLISKNGRGDVSGNPAECLKMWMSA